MRYSFAGEPSPDSRRSRMLLNAMVLTLLFPARINELHRTRLAFAIRQTPNTRRGDPVSQNRSMHSKQKPVLAGADCLKDLPLSTNSEPRCRCFEANVLPV